MKKTIITLLFLILLTGCVSNNKLSNKADNENISNVDQRILKLADDHFQENLYANRLYDDGILTDGGERYIKAFVSSVGASNDWKFTNEEYNLIETGYIDHPFLIKHSAYFDPVNKDNDTYIIYEKLYLYDFNKLWFPISEHSWLINNGESVSDFETSFLDKNNDWVEIFKD